MEKTIRNEENYTGVKDRHGNKIHEGDTVDCWDDNSSIYRGVIERRNGYYSFNTGGVYLDGWDNAENIELKPITHNF